MSAAVIKCPFCSADWSDANLRIYNVDAADQCESGRWSDETASVKIVCHACNRLMYQKDGIRCEVV